MKWSITGLCGLMLLGAVAGILLHSGDVRWVSLAGGTALVIADRLGWTA